MLLHADYVVLADDAQLTTPFVGLALVARGGVELPLARRGSATRARSRCSRWRAGRRRERPRVGIANRVGARAELVAAATQVAASLARQPIAR